ncbi:MAG TPA: hypothetical protein VF960_01560 [Chloroflexota bacterium]
MRTGGLMTKSSRVSALLAEAEARWGRGALVRWGDSHEASETEVIPTGFRDLDEALGIMGLPRGRISELFGMDSSGKEALAASIAVQCQKRDEIVAWIDPSGRLDPEQIKALGVESASMLVARPRSERDALEMAVRLARSGGISMLVFDLTGSLDGGVRGDRIGVGATSWWRSSMSAGRTIAGRSRLLHQGQDGRGTGPLSTPFGQLPLRARVVSDPGVSAGHETPPYVILPVPYPPSPVPSSLNLALRRLVAAVHKNRIAFLFIADSSHGTSSGAHRSNGGQALRYFASIRLEMERREWIRRGHEVVGCRSSVRVVKNKLAAPSREAEVDLQFYRFPPVVPPVSPRKQPGTPARARLTLLPHQPIETRYYQG